MSANSAASTQPVARYQRFTLYQRIEHVVLISSFVTLAVTGLPQKFADAAWAEALIATLGGIESVRILHRYAATLLMLGTIYHFAAIGYKILVQRLPMTMLPTLQDALDALNQFTYNLGLNKSRPQLPRYTFEEKAEYWALIWGTVVMIITGFMLWNPIATTRFFPGQIIPAAKAAHGGEALLAVLSIIVWHMYGVHLRHFNTAMWTGFLTEEEMRHEHAKELADLKAGLGARPAPPAMLRARQQMYIPIAVLISLAFISSVVWFVTFEQTAVTTLPPVSVAEIYAPQTPTPLPPTPTSPPVGALTWNDYIVVLTAAKCSACHGGAGGLSLDTYAAALAGGRNGAVIAPGDSANSLIIQIQEGGGHPGQLSAEEISRLKQWIDRGAPEN